MSRILRLLAVALVISGCGAARLPTTVSVSPTVCVPPGMEPITAWVSGPSELLVVDDRAMRPVVVVRQMYRVGVRAIMALWVDGVLAVVDPEPGDQSVPAWMDRGLVDATGRLETHRIQACDWERAAGPQERT